MSIPDTNAARRDTIGRAMQLIDSADPADLTRWLGQIHIRDSFKRNPAGLRAYFADTLHDGDFLFPAWKAAQQLLHAAGLPY